MGFPFFNPPTIQKVNKIEEGNFFVPTEGVELDSEKELHPTRVKVKKAIKIAVIAVAVVVFVLLGIEVITNPEMFVPKVMP